MAEPGTEDAERGLVAAVAERLEKRFGHAPAVAVVLGSGLASLVDALVSPHAEPYEALGLPPSSVAGHAGRLVVGRLGEPAIAVCAGRVHLYEGKTPREVVRTVRALAAWGVRAVVLTNAVGGISDGFGPGTLVAVEDHLNLQGQNPLVGPAYATRFPDLSRAYDPQLRAAFLDAAHQLGLPVRSGILAAMLGPSYETAAEIRMLARLGADVVGMSTVPEVLACAEIGLRCAVLSVVSNWAAGLTVTPLTHAEVVEATGRSAEGVVRLMRAALPAIMASLHLPEEG